MKRVIHLIPYDGIGGVEEAARSMKGTSSDGRYAFEVRYLFPNVNSRVERARTNSVRRLMRAARKLSQDNPELVIVSLWRAVLAGLIAKMLNPKIRLVLFVHNSRDAHAADWLVTRLGLWFSDAVWADSQASIDARFKQTPKKPTCVISFLLRKSLPLPPSPLAPTFIYWGRKSKQKDLPRALRLLSQIRSKRSDAYFTMIGPEGDDAAEIERTIKDLNLCEAVDVREAMGFDAIRQLASQRCPAFYLQTSQYEGMAISVTEAMQLGLVPVVTPVGEIANYCSEDNAFILDRNEAGDADDAGRLLDLLHSPSDYEKRRANALKTWETSPLYSDSVLAAVDWLLGDGSSERGASA